MNGHWYGIEILEHVNKGRPNAESCIKIEFRYRNSNYIDLIWRERNFQVDYTFVILDQTQRGNWTSQGQQSGNLRTIYFSKRVTFCSSTIENRREGW